MNRQRADVTGAVGAIALIIGLLVGFYGFVDMLLTGSPSGGVLLMCLPFVVTGWVSLVYSAKADAKIKAAEEADEQECSGEGLA